MRDLYVQYLAGYGLEVSDLDVAESFCRAFVLRGKRPGVSV